MTLPFQLAILSGSLIGLLLGATGGGGSLLAIPLLVYVVGVPVQQAALISLIVVGVSALVGALHKSQENQVRGLAAVLFSTTGAAGAWFGAYGHRIVSEESVLTLFGLLMFGVSWWNLRRLDVDEQAMNQEGCARNFSPQCVGRGLGIGFAVGVLTGFFGIGGGFLIVPALMFIMGFPAQMAVGTSLLTVALIASGGIIGHLNTVTVDTILVSWLLAGAVCGVVLGSRWSAGLDGKAFRKALGLLTGAIGFLMVAAHLLRLFRP